MKLTPVRRFGDTTLHRLRTRCLAVGMTALIAGGAAGLATGDKDYAVDGAVAGYVIATSGVIAGDEVNRRQRRAELEHPNKVKSPDLAERPRGIQE